MGAGAIAAREGVYTTWAIQAIYDTGVGFSPMMEYDAVGIRNDGRVIWQNAPTNNTYIISPAGELLATLGDEQWLIDEKICSEYHSLTNKYLLSISVAFTDLIVLEGLVEVWRRAVDNDKGVYTLTETPLTPLGSLSISPSGEWIVAMVKEVGNNGLIFIYKGSP